ncbi:hypothetical protein [Actinomyces vulturis]|uniref:hypothetical protein n=1 Tax=Actinomyces vulturis TaxID=1857645 RepID=UPI000833BA58|nr:hypothetical protein [Actinomyces vulturis]
MALRFNPPPNWPAPPEGFVPPAGWQPDPAWGPAPEGWELWVEDSVPTSAGSAQDPAWAPTQAISSAGSVANPTGASASAPSAEPAPINPVPQSAPMASSAAGTAPTAVMGAPMAASAPGAVPMAGSAPGGAPMAASAPGAVPMAGSAPGAAPMAASAPGAAPYNYPQAPTPFQGQAPGSYPPAAASAPQSGAWQPVDVNGPNGPQGGNTPITKKPWFWVAIAAVVVLCLVGVGALIFSGGNDKEAKPAPAATKAANSDKKDESKKDDSKKDESKKDESTKGDSGSKPTPADSGKKDDSSKSDGSDVGRSMNNPGDPETQFLTMYASKYSSDPDAHVEISFGKVNWDADADVQAAEDFFYEAPPADSVYIRLPVTVTYHGKGQMNSFDISIDYVKDGSTFSAKTSIADDDFRMMDMPRDGGTVTGYFTFLIPKADVNSGIFAVNYDFSGDEMYMQAK